MWKLSYNDLPAFKISRWGYESGGSDEEWRGGLETIDCCPLKYSDGYQPASQISFQEVMM